MAQGLALCGQCGAINQHAIAFNAKQGFAGGNFDVIDGTQFGIGLNARPQHTMDIQTLVRIFARIFRGLVDIDLGKRNLMHPFAAHVFVSQTRAANMPQCQTGQVVRLVNFQHITLQHGVMRIAAHLNALIGKHMPVVFNVLAHLELEWVFKPGLELGQNFLQGQLHRRIRAFMSQGQIGCLTRFDTPADAHQIGTHGIEGCGLGVNGHTLCGL